MIEKKAYYQNAYIYVDFHANNYLYTMCISSLLLLCLVYSEIKIKLNLNLFFLSVKGNTQKPVCCASIDHLKFLCGHFTLKKIFNMNFSI